MSDSAKNRIYELIVDENIKNERLDKYLSSHIDELSREKIKRLIKDGCVIVNQQVVLEAKHPITGLDKIVISAEITTHTELEPYDFALNIVFEDEFLAVIDKPSGISVHPGAGVRDKTLANAMIARFKNQLSSMGGAARPGIVHRLDKDTSGLLVIAKDDITHAMLSEALAQREIKRCYQALCFGQFERNEGTIKANIIRSSRDRTKMCVVRNGGKHAVTHYRVVQNIKDQITLLELRLETGRTHQIRVHLEHLRHPVVGDQVYGKALNYNLSNFSVEQKAVIKGFPRQALHAASLEFTHPRTNELISLESPLPSDLRDLLAALNHSI